MSDMVEVARNSVQSWEIDQMGHMNVQFYVQKATDGLAGLAVEIGLGLQRRRALNTYLHVREMHVRFLRERRVGTAFFMRAGVLDVQAEQLQVYLEMVGTISGDVAAAFTLDVELRGEASDAPRAIDDAVLRAARALHVERPQHGQVRGVSYGPPCAALALNDAAAMGLITTYQACIAPAQCDPCGSLSLQQFMGIVSNAVPNLLARGRSERAPDAQAGGAALEYRYVFRQLPRAGDTVTVRTGLKAVGAKTYSWCRWLFDLETGVALASAEAVGVALDLDTRKATTIPEDMRAGLEGFIVNGLGV